MQNPANHARQKTPPGSNVEMVYPTALGTCCKKILTAKPKKWRKHSPLYLLHEIRSTECIRRHQKPNDKVKPKPAYDDKKNITCQFCGLDHKGPRSQSPASGKTCGACSKKGHFARMCRGKKKPKDLQHKQQSSAKYVQQRNKKTHETLDFAFQPRADESNTFSSATVQVRIKGVEGKMEADSCSTANIMDA